MSQIILKNLEFGYTEPLYEEVNVTITEKDRIGIVGNNGEGKSTLLKCIAGAITDYSGQIIKPKDLTLGYMEQNIPEEIKHLSLYEAIAEKIPKDERDFNLWKVDVALDTFKAPEIIRDRTIGKLSGGWQRLALLARAAMSNPDILLLDEPTNHLDVGKILVLEEWLNTQISDIPIVAVSHDRGFLEACTNRTLFLRSAQVYDYKYSYLKAKALLFEDDKAAANQREKELKELERLQKSAHNLRQIGVDNYSSKALQKAKQIERKIERLRSQVTAVHQEAKRDVKLSSSDMYANRLISINNFSVKAPDNSFLFKIEKLEVAQGDRIVLLGANGSGKSQFIRHLNYAFNHREEGKKEGISITPTAKLGYIDQHLSNLPLEKSLKDYILDIRVMDQQRATGLLVSIGFPYDTQSTKIKDLSPGQRSRLNVLALRLLEPNFYIMDEPTNHLDIAGQEALEAEIIEHGAASILVSHDRAFVSNLGTKFLEIYKGELREITSPDIFYKSLGNDPNDVPSNSKSTVAIEKVNNAPTNLDERINNLGREKELRTLRAELKITESNIENLENKIKALELTMGQLSPSNDNAKILQEYQQLKESLDQQMQIWENLEESLSK